MRTLAVIPARGGSRRIPRKNIRALAGRPMLAYTVEAALASRLFARVVVTTDSPEIAAVAAGLGAETPFLRSPALADDHTPVSLATLDVLERLEAAGERYDAVAQLMPNCPLRTAADLAASAAQFAASGGDGSQLSVVRYGWQNPWWAMRRDAAGRLEPLFAAEMAARSQDLPELVCPTGAVWWAAAGRLRQERTFHCPGRTGWEIPWQRGLDIDTMEDWEMAELLLVLDRERLAGAGAGR
jgi:N-acylneuraminate cytidylyltransferase